MFSAALREVPITQPSSSCRTSRVVMMRRSSSTSISTGTSAMGAISSWGVIYLPRIDRRNRRNALVDEIDGFLAELVHGSHHAGICLVTPLQNNQIGELTGDIDGGSLNRAADEVVAAAGVRQSNGRGSGT